MERRVITIRGIVQGVGFRPYVSSLARQYQLDGFVRNQAGSVIIEVEGEGPQLDDFLSDLKTKPPPLAEISDVRWRATTVHGDQGFRIDESVNGNCESIYISADVAICGDCLAELFNPRDRRYKYPFINCTNCGPRLTIIEGAPYDRERTTMRGFAMCPDCRREYEDPLDRRFHAQPIACPACGPQLEVCWPNGSRIPTGDPLRLFANALKEGRIGAVKGLGGYHLTCDAGNSLAAGELRRRKCRDEKPMAVMVRDVAAARRFCRVINDERELLQSPRRPIVLLRKNCSDSLIICDNIAPGNPYLGVMLPYTPLHYLLLDAVGDTPLVMTSGNRSNEPIAYLDDDAFRRLGDIADVVLRHNRPIHVRCDDSVTRVVDGSELLTRRSRGYAPQAIQLPFVCEGQMLAVGGQLKGAFALAADDHATLSHHLGDLEHFEGYRQFERDVLLYEELFRISPEVIVRDLHPDYASTQYAVQRAKHSELPTLAVQHHHAHMASCMAENGLNEPVIGVTFDGTGFGIDEATNEPVVWGGEFLIGDYYQFRRAARLRYVPMLGGERAAVEPWRMAVAHLIDAECSFDVLDERVPTEKLRTAATMAARNVNSPMTSSAGRLFDAIAAIAGVRDYIHFEGQAAMDLEWVATDTPHDCAYPFEIDSPDDETLPDVVDTRPLIRAAVGDARNRVGANRIARRFHSTIVAIICDVCKRIAERTGLKCVVLSGGVFMNALLVTEVSHVLSHAGFRVFRHKRVPPNDGGLCLGQIAVAAAWSEQRRRPNKSARKNTLTSEVTIPNGRPSICA